MAEDIKKPLFTDIDADEVPAVTVVESLCVACEQNGTTKMLLTRIPFFKEIIVMSFECPHCGYTNNEVQSAGKVQEKGCIFKLQVLSPEVLNRQLVKSDAASFSIPELEFESQPFLQKGELNTIEGLLEKAISGLEEGQAVRKIIDPDTAAKIDSIIAQLTKCRNGEMKFTFVLNDCSGNSFIENPEAPAADPLLTVTKYKRSSEQDAQLGLQPVSTDDGEEDQEDEGEEEQNIKDEVLGFPTNCSSCNAPAETKMKVVNIPHFKEVIIMATTCDSCGHRTNEVKSGTGIEEKGTRMALRITDPSDLNRDVLKSETCQLKIPSLQLETLAETLGGRFTTLEGLLTNLKEQIQNLNPFGFGDSPAFSAEQLQAFLAKLDKIIKGEQMDVVIILDDPAGNSYMQNLYAPDPDPELEIVYYDRTKEQEDELGISDMKTEGY